MGLNEKASVQELALVDQYRELSKASVKQLKLHPHDSVSYTVTELTPYGKVENVEIGWEVESIDNNTHSAVISRLEKFHNGIEFKVYKPVLLERLDSPKLLKVAPGNKVSCSKYSIEQNQLVQNVEVGLTVESIEEKSHTAVVSSVERFHNGIELKLHKRVLIDNLIEVK